MIALVIDCLLFVSGGLALAAAQKLIAWSRASRDARASLQRRRKASRILNEEIARRSAEDANARTAAANGFGSAH
jgi:hypothetical protein